MRLKNRSAIAKIQPFSQERHHDWILKKIIYKDGNLVLSFDDKDWQLYSSKSGVKAIAAKMNKEVEKIINQNPRVDLNKLFDQISSTVLAKYCDFGASDTEPRWVLRDLIERVYDLGNSNFCPKPVARAKKSKSSDLGM